jgi:hypothetical protein
VFVGIQCEKHGLACVYESELQYSHEGHGSMGGWPSSRVGGFLLESHRWAAEALVMSQEMGGSSVSGRG